MRISDWSSDVCSSDLNEVRDLGQRADGALAVLGGVADVLDVGADDRREPRGQGVDHRARIVDAQGGLRHVGDRKSVVSGKSVSVRVDLGGRRIIKKKKQTTL